MKKIMWLIASMFIAGLFFWYGKVGSTSTAVANINGDKITLADYQKQVMQQLRRFREEQEEELEESQILQIRRQVLSTLITQEVLYQESKRIGIKVLDEEVANTIHSLPQFQQEGKFNFGLYLQTLRYSLNSSAEEFEELIRKNIANRKLERTILSSAIVTRHELSLHYMDRNGSLTDFDQKSEELRNDILQSKRTAIYRNWINDLQQRTKIKVDPELAGITQ